MPKIGDMEGVRGSDEGYPVSLYRDDETHRVVIRGINDGGFGCVEIDLIDLIDWLRDHVSELPDDAAKECTAAFRKHIDRYRQID